MLDFSKMTNDELTDLSFSIQCELIKRRLYPKSRWTVESNYPDIAIEYPNMKSSSIINDKNYEKMFIPIIKNTDFVKLTNVCFHDDLPTFEELEKITDKPKIN